MIDYKPFWEELKQSEEITYTLVTRHRISRAAICKLRKNKPVNTTILNRRCGIFACALQGIVGVCRTGREKKEPGRGTKGHWKTAPDITRPDAGTKRLAGAKRGSLAGGGYFGHKEAHNGHRDRLSGAAVPNEQGLLPGLQPGRQQGISRVHLCGDIDVLVKRLPVKTVFQEMIVGFLEL